MAYFKSRVNEPRGRYSKTTVKMLRLLTEASTGAP